MTPYAIRQGYLKPEKVALFARLREDFDRMPDVDPSDAVSCHAVCRALERRHPGATCVDGHFHATGHEHSWLDLGDGVIADMYPIAGAVPFMVDASHWMVPWNRLYIRKDDLFTTEAERSRHERMADVLVEALELADAGWIVHDGRGMPVGSDEVVDVRFMGYDAVRTPPHIRQHEMMDQEAGTIRWAHIGSQAAPGHHHSNVTHWRRSAERPANA